MTNNQTVSIAQKILINRLELMMSIGVLPIERQEKQRVIVSAVIESNKDNGNKSDQINDTICYAGLIKEIQSLAQSRHFNLIEHFGQSILDTLSNHDSIMSIELTIEKPDIIKEVESVGVIFSASKSS